MSQGHQLFVQIHEVGVKLDALRDKAVKRVVIVKQEEEGTSTAPEAIRSYLVADGIVSEENFGINLITMFKIINLRADLHN